MSAILLVLGILLIIASWTPICQVATNAVWDREDTIAYGELVQENHRLAYQAVERSGLTEEQLEAKRKKVKDALATKTQELKYAKTRSELWSRIFFLTGSMFAAIGAFVYVLNRSRVS